MAQKKSRVPTPPRKVDAPKPRPRQPSQPRTPSTGGGGSRRTRWLFLGLGAVILVVGVGIALATTLGGGQDASAALSAAGCTEQSPPSQGRQHVLELEEGFQYNTFPPTSGPHHPQWAIWNIYDRPVPLIRQVHNLEHGGIVVQYGDEVPAETVSQIEAWYRQDPTALLVAPLPGLNDKVALTAWGQLAICPGFDEAAFNAFRDAHIFKGPERFPENRLQPGM